MITSWIKYVNEFGGWSGSQLFWQVRYGKTKTLTVPGYSAAMHIRPQTSDAPTFEQVILHREYDLTDFRNRIGPVNTIIDAGANIGFTSVFFARMFPEARIIAIEPDTGNFEKLQQNTAHLPQVKCLMTGLWHRQASLVVKDGGYGAYGFTVEEVPAGYPGALHAIALDDLVHEYGISVIDILKIDIEGSEKEVFSANIQKWLPMTKCLIIELHDRKRKGCSQAVFTALQHGDFSMEVRGENLLFLNNDL
ncbi:MAG: FkbM family methyltransferase [Saprospiraceae bacterium]